MNQINLHAEDIILEITLPPEIALFVVIEIVLFLLPRMRKTSKSLLKMRFFYCVVTFVVKCASITAPISKKKIMGIVKLIVS